MNNATRTALTLFALLLAAPSWGSTCSDYNRRDWPHWSAGDVKGDRLDTRQELLIERSLVPVTVECGRSLPRVRSQGATYAIDPDGPRRCRVISGRWLDQYGGIEIVADTGEAVALLATVEHVVPLAEAHRSGGACWDRERRRQFANDKRFLLIVSRTTNSSRSDDDTYLPTHRPCEQAELYTTAKAVYGLNYDLDEGSFYDARLTACRQSR